MYEPTNLEATYDSNGAPPIYMGNVAPPLSLPLYLEEFATEGTTTIEIEVGDPVGNLLIFANRLVAKSE